MASSGIGAEQSKLQYWKELMEKCKTNWDKIQGARDFASEFELHTSLLRRDLRIALEAVTEDPAQRSAKQEAIQEVADMLIHDKKPKSNSKIDSCVRWSILLGLVSSAGDDKAWNYDKELVTMLVNAEPFLAFENPNTTYDEMGRPTPRGRDVWKDNCRNEKAHWYQKNHKSTPFHRAATNGNAKALKLMITALEEHYGRGGESESRRLLFFPLLKKDNPVEGVLRLPDPESKKSGLQLAAEAGQGMKETLNALLAYPRVAWHPDPTFTDALDSGAYAVVETFLNKPSLVTKFVTADNIICALGKVPRPQSKDASVQEPGKEDETGINSRINIIRLLIQKAKTDPCFDEEKRKEIFSIGVVEKIIALNLKEVWEDEKLKDLGLEKHHPLHFAVLHQKLDFVKMFVEEYKDTVTEPAELPDTDGKGHYPLWFNNRKWNPRNPETERWVDRSSSANEREKRTPEERLREEIREELVIGTIRQKDKMQDLAEILRLSGARELCFDISLFNSKSYRLYDFVRSLIAHRDENKNLLVYEPTLKYARFPSMDLHPKDREVFGEPVLRDHKEVFDILDWLSTVRSVKSVIELKVPDRLVNPHSEEEIGRYVKKFGVEVLDWRFLDLSLSVFADAKVPKDQIRSLHLYSSGKRGVINHWMRSEQGLAQFEKLAFLRVHPVEETMTETAIDKASTHIRKEFRQLRRRMRKNFWELDFDVKPQSWNEKHDGLADLADLAEKAFPKLSPFISEYQKLVSKDPPKGWKPTKIAIIDNGIMSMSPATQDEVENHKHSRKAKGAAVGDQRITPTPGSSEPVLNGNIKPTIIPAEDNDSAEDTGDEKGADRDSENKAEDLSSSRGNLDSKKRRDKVRGQRTLWSRINRGRSFVDTDHQLSPWLFASDPHGTQMANLICALDPTCQIYVAKVTDGRDGITPHRVSRAIDWAREENVDIISMSFAMLETSPALNQSVKDAASDGIVMLCATHDEGANVDRAYPASMDNTLTVAACNEYGSLLRPVKAGGYQYMVPGLDVPAGVVPFLDSADRISGSSVAAAIAAGLSSLILSCLRVANPDRDFKKDERATAVESKLGELRQNSESAYLMLDKFGGLDKSTIDGVPINAEDVMNKFKLEGVILNRESDKSPAGS